MTSMQQQERGSTSESSRAMLFALAGLFLASLYVLHALVVDYQSDDGFIALRYVRNLLNGDGIVFNPGERVEGYTCFLWIMLLAGCKVILPGVDLLPMSRVLGLVFGVLCILLVCRMSRTIYGEYRVRGLLAGAFLAAHSGFAAWGMGGLETTLYAFLLIAGANAYVVYLQSQRLHYVAPILFALAALTRPDGLLLFGVTSLHFFVFERRRCGQWFNRRLITWSLPFLVIFVPFFLWRYSYYGYPMPNTAYAKVGQGLDQYTRGLWYVYRYLILYGGYVFVPAAVVLMSRKRVHWRDYLALLIAVYIAYVVYVGGDGLAFSRFFAYVAPVIYLLAQDGLGAFHDLARRWIAGRKLAVAGAVVTAMCLVASTRQTLFPLLLTDRYRWYEPQSKLRFPGNGVDHDYRWFDNYFVDRLAVAARWLDKNAPTGSLVASTPAGAIAFYMDHAVIDMLGLNDEHIAHVQVDQAGHGRAGHEKGDGRYVLSREPNYILMGNVAVFPWQVTEEMMPDLLRLRSEHELWDEPEFHRLYEFRCIRVANEGLFQYFAFFKRRPDIDA